MGLRLGTWAESGCTAKHQVLRRMRTNYAIAEILDTTLVLLVLLNEQGNTSFGQGFHIDSSYTIPYLGAMH